MSPSLEEYNAANDAARHRELVVELSAIRLELRRIADALEASAPEPGPSPDQCISYWSEPGESYAVQCEHPAGHTGDHYGKSAQGVYRWADIGNRT